MERQDVSFLCFRFILPALLFLLLNVFFSTRETLAAIKIISLHSV